MWQCSAFISRVTMVEHPGKQLIQQLTRVVLELTHLTVNMAINGRNSGSLDVCGAWGKLPVCGFMRYTQADIKTYRNKCLETKATEKKDWSHWNSSTELIDLPVSHTNRTKQLGCWIVSLLLKSCNRARIWIHRGEMKAFWTGNSLLFLIIASLK